MSNTIAYVDNQTLTNIADAVRYKTGTNGKMLLSDIPDKIRNIDGIIPSGSIKIDANGVYDVTEKVEVDVNVNPDPYMGDTEVTPSAETQVLATKKKFVQEDITVHPAPTETLSTTSNGTFTPSDGKVGFSQVTVDVNPDLRPLSVSENGTYQPDGFDGYSGVNVSVPTVEKVLINETVLTEDKTAENITERFWIENYIPSDQNFIGVYVITFENNNATRYGAVKILALGRFYQNKRPLCVIWRLENGIVEKYDIDNNSTRSCTASIGTVIKTYKLQYDGEI